MVPAAPLLGYEQQLLHDLLEEDALCITAAGLGWQKYVAVLLRHHSQSGSPGCVLVIGANPLQRKQIQQELQRQDPTAAAATPAAADISADVPAIDRIKLYQSNAACFVTTRILVVDLLSARCKAPDVAGLIVANAHRVSDESGEGFAIRLYRQGNSSGWLRAFSDVPTSFAGVSKVEKVLRSCWLRRLVLLPRFQRYVQEDLGAAPPALEEWEQEPSGAQATMLEALGELLGELLKDLGRTNRLDMTELTPARGLCYPFDRVARTQLAGGWHTLSWRTRAAVKDLGTVGELARTLMTTDAVTFLSYLEVLRASEALSTTWLFLDPAHILFEQARRRVYVVVNPTQHQQQQQGPAAGGTGTSSAAKKRGRGGGSAGGPSSKARKKGAAASPAAAAGSHAAVVGTGEGDPGAGTEPGEGGDVPRVQAAVVEPVLEQPPKWALLREVLEGVAAHRAAVTAAATAALEQLDTQQQQEQEQQQQQGHGAGTESLPTDPAPVGATAAAGAGAGGGLSEEEQQQQQQQQQLLPGSDVDQRAQLEAGLQAAAAARVLVVVREQHELKQLQRVITQGGEGLMQELYAAYLAAKLDPAKPNARARQQEQQAAERAAEGGVGADEQQGPNPGEGPQGAAGGAGRGGGARGRGRGSAGGAAGGGWGGRGRGRGRGRRFGGRTDMQRVDPAHAHLAARAPAPPAAEQAALLAAAKQAAQQGTQQQQQEAEAATAGKQPKQQQATAPGKQSNQQKAAAAGKQPNKQQGRTGRSGAEPPVIVVDSDSSSEGSGWDLGEGSEGGGPEVSPATTSARRPPAAGAPATAAAVAATTGGTADAVESTAAAAAAAGGGGAGFGGSAGRDLSAGVYLYAMESGEPDPLHTMQPVTVILYSPELAWVRAVEVYQAERAVLLGTRVPPVQLVLLHYSPAPERDKFLAAGSREADAFSALIAAKQHVVLPVNSRPDNPMQLVPLQQGASGGGAATAPELWLDVYTQNRATRQAGRWYPGGGPAAGAPNRGGTRGALGGGVVPHHVVVDVREFMSSLPSVLHQQGFRLTPVTLEVGDYVLSPELVVERKALPDLFSSLASGRLYHQAEALTRCYKTPLLLIEFEGDKSFELTSASRDAGPDIDARAPQSRLALLLLHFPRLRLLWSRSQHATGEMFLALKRLQEEPVPTAAALVGLPLSLAAALTLGSSGAGTGSGSGSGAGSSTGAGAVGGENMPPPGAAAGAGAGGGAGGMVGGTMVATSAMVHASPAAALVVASQLAAGSSSQGAASAGSTSSQQQQGQGQSQAQQQQQTETVVNQAALELLRRLPGVTDSNWRGLVGGFSSLAELAGASRERLAALMGGERPARMLHDFLHAPCPVR